MRSDGTDRAAKAERILRGDRVEMAGRAQVAERAEVLTGLSGLRQLRGLVETRGLTGQRERMSEPGFQRGLERLRWLTALKGQGGLGRLRYHTEGKHYQGIVVFNK